jgi:hypothetical protein
MAGLDPAIHVFLNGISAKKDVDGRRALLGDGQARA